MTALSSGVARGWFVNQIAQAGVSGLYPSSVRRSGVGAKGVFFLPYLLGEQAAIWDPEARGAFVGLKAWTNRSDLYRAVLESTAYSLSQMLRAYHEIGVRPRDFVICGGGAKNTLLREIVTDTLGIPTRVHGSPGEVAVIGVAMCTAVGLHQYSTLSAAAEGMVRYSGRLSPNAKNHVKYSDMLRLYESAYSALKKIMHALREFEGR